MMTIDGRVMEAGGITKVVAAIAGGTERAAAIVGGKEASTSHGIETAGHRAALHQQ